MKREVVDSFIGRVRELYGYDFDAYKRVAFERRLEFIERKYEKELGRISEEIRDPLAFAGLLPDLTVTYSEFFRDPVYFATLRQEILPILRTYPVIKAWVAGSASGEEAYSLAILLHEEGLLPRSRIYATDINRRALEHGKAGIYSLDRLNTLVRNYRLAGGERAVMDYFSVSYDFGKIESFLASRVTFADHNLVTDGSFGELHLIQCRNVLIYFRRDSQERVLRLFHDSLVPGGILGLGAKETLSSLDARRGFELLDRKSKIYEKRPFPSSRT